MAPDPEIIDVDNFCSELEKTDELLEMRAKCRFLDVENRRLENRANSTDRMNEELRRNLFRQDHLGNVLAQHLGFANMETAIETVQSDGSWSIAGHAELRTRTLQLEDELAKLVVAGKEAQEFIKELNEQITSLEQYTEELKDDLKRVREDRDAARQEASRQMQEARQWRQELQTTLPEMQRLICELQKSQNGFHQTTPLAEKANILPIQHSDQQENTLGGASCLADQKTAQNYKVEYECLLKKYNVLFEVKNKVSRKYARDLATWKKIRDWLFQEGIVPGSKPGKVHLKIKRNKMPSELFEDPIAAPGNEAEVISADIPQEGRKGTMLPSLTPIYAQRLQDSSTFQRLNNQKDLTEPSSTLTIHSPLVRKDVRNVDSKVADINQLTQESVTEPPSSMFIEVSPSRARDVKTPSPKVLVIDSSPERDIRRGDDDNNETEGDEKPNRTRRTPPLSCNIVKSKSKILSGGMTPQPSLPLFKPGIAEQPKTEPPRLQKRYFAETPKGRPNRKATSCVLVPDSPLKQAGSRYSFPPLETSRARHTSRGKRKAIEVLTDEDDTEFSKNRTPRHNQSLSTKPHKESFRDYMQFKGRGRYSNATAMGKQTINREFEIDAEKNGGVKHQYDAVVRDKLGRKQMEAVDCECCRDYYEAIGPLPPRLQAPLWKSPGSEASQRESRPCRYGSGANASDTPSSPITSKQREAHKQEISRHRHDWAPPATPPDFWKIGFPTTQEVNDINRRATDMHARKFERIKGDVSSNTGRYRKRG